jgi:hypothetical protein
MTGWEKESVDLINDGLFQITDPGPLHAPIHKFSIRRDETLALILETEAAPDAKSSAAQHPSGTVRLNTEKVELVNIAKIKATLTGVQTYSVTTSHDGPRRSALKELARVHRTNVTLTDPKSAAYTIEWLENLPASPFLWPDTINTVKETTITRRIALTDGGITLSGSDKREGFDNAAAALNIANQLLYVCALTPSDAEAGIKPGCIIYTGTPDELARKRIRTALSFALGVYLVELGHTVYDEKWDIVLSASHSAYSLGRKAFDLAPMPLAPLGKRFQYEIGRPELTRMVSALVENYDALDLGNLSWAYWHACAATVHIAPAHFGAAIEALQRAYIKKSPDAITSTILVAAKWED